MKTRTMWVLTAITLCLLIAVALWWWFWPDTFHAVNNAMHSAGAWPADLF